MVSSYIGPNVVFPIHA